MRRKISLAIFMILSFVFMMSQVYAEELSGKFITTKSSGVSWGGSTCGHFTANLTIDGKNISHQAFCMDHKLNTPASSVIQNAKVYYPGDEGYNPKVASLLYYAMGGEGDITDGSTKAIVGTSLALDYIVNGNTHNSQKNNNYYNDLIAHANSQDAPEGVSYVMFSSTAANQRLATYWGIKQNNGSIAMRKVDPNGRPLSGATFHVWNDNNGINEWRTTSSENDGWVYVENLPQETYWVEETTAPWGMINLESDPGRKQQRTVTPGGRAEFVRQNSYQKGSLRLLKYDKDNEGNTKGDATLEGAVFELYAMQDIYEGYDRIYTAGQYIRNVTTDVNGYSEEVSDLPLGRYYFKEVLPSRGFLLNNDNIEVNVEYKGQNVEYSYSDPVRVSETPIYGRIRIVKRQSGLSHDPEEYLPGAQFRAVLLSDESQVYYSTVTGDDGVCLIDNIPYGEYRIEECVVPDSANPITSFNIQIERDKNEYTYECSLIDTVKSMRVAIHKNIRLNSGEKTDAKASGAVFTIYRNAQCTDRVCDITPTDASGYAISDEIKTGTYYIKETKFPIGIDPDAKMPGENVTYRNKVYVVSADNKAQGTEVITVNLPVENVPNRHDVPVYKSIEATSNTPKFPLDQCEFTATLKSSIGTDHVFSRKCTAQTDKNGYCIIEDLPYGEYVIEETKVSPISLKCDNFTVFVDQDRKVRVEPYTTYITDAAKVMQIKIRKVDANRKDSDAPDMTQGDAKLNGAIYEVYRYDPQTDDYTEFTYEINVNHKDSDGYWCAESADLLVGKYMVKEKVKYSETVDGVKYNYSYAEGYLADPEEYYFEQRPDLQTVKLTKHYDTSKEEVIRGSVHVAKYDNQLNESDEVPSKGAILRLTLDSSVTNENPLGTYYDLTIDEIGYGEFVEEKSREKYYPYTIPYGKYTITEIRESDQKLHTSFFVQPEDVVVKNQAEKQYRIEADEPVELYIKVQKRDKDTGATVELDGAKFKVWDMQENKWLEQMSYEDGGFISEFRVNGEGLLTTPEKVIAGEYIVYETQAPKGYYLEDELRIPENEEDIGKKDKGGKYINITKSAMGIVESTVANKKDYFFTVDMSDRPLVSRLEIIKTGEMLTGVVTKTTDYGELYTPTYKEKGLDGVTYEITAAEDIKSPDGRVVYVKKGTKVDTITTNEEGIATTKELYPGEYQIKETVTPEGYLTDNNIANVVLESSNNELQRVKYTTVKLTNIRKKLGLTFPKHFDEIKYKVEEDYVPEATFAVYASNEITTSKGDMIIPKNGLVDLITIKGDADVTTNIDLPQGKYYVKEVATSYPYTISSEQMDFDLKFNDNDTQEYNITSGNLFTNIPETASVTLIKVSTSSMQSVLIDGDSVDHDSIKDDVKNMINTSQNMTKAEIKNYFKEKGIKSVAGATYGIYLDENCTNILKVLNDETNEFEDAKIITDESGMITLEDIPLGEYYIKELDAPKGYEISNEVIKVVLTAEDKDGTVYTAVMEDYIREEFIKKTDIFDGDVVPNCIFTITNENGEEILRSKTSENGIAYIPVDAFENGKKYFFTEISAPEEYELNTEPHPFVAQIEEVDGELIWTGEVQKVENTRKSKELRILKIDEETGEPLKDCVFSIALLDENGEIKTREDGSVVYLVENAETDENGEYLIEKAYYGTYKFTEVQAPEGYELSEKDMEGYVFTIDENSADRIDFIVTNTGDIAVITLSGILLVSAISIISILRRKYSKQ